MAVGAFARDSSRWSRSYPPLLLLILAVLVAALVLPSSLNIPNSNPSTVLEYAPVPPEDDDPPPPPEGNLSSLGLGSSGTLTAGGAPPPPPPRDVGTGSRPQTKRCVGNPPRQTEDPMAPPCVPFFDGENFGATYQGVTGNEITVLLYWDVGAYSGETSPRHGTYVDLDRARLPNCPDTWPANGPNPDGCDNPLIRVSRALARYFNERWQTYDRRVHFWAYYSDVSTAAGRRSDAQDNWNRLRPFAVLDQATFNGFNTEYVAAMAARGVLVFSSLNSQPNAFYRSSAPMAWSFWPDVEHWAALYSSYVCRKVAPYQVTHSGNPHGTGIFQNRPRKFGAFYTTDPGHPELHLFRRLVKDQLEACGVRWAEEGTFPESGFIVNNGDTGADQTQTVAKFQSSQITTVLYLGGVEGKFTHAAEAAKYYPEIVVAGDLYNDAIANARLQNQTVWQNAWAVQLQLRIDRLDNTPGYRAFKEGDPQGSRDDGPYGRDLYRDHFQLFQGIQVAGPRLTPDSVDQGFHAIPSIQSTDPYVGACFFDAGDYSCLKDAIEVWWDPQGVPEGSSQPGCFRMVAGGRRFQAGRWEPGDTVFANRSDACSGFGGFYRISPT